MLDWRNYWTPGQGREHPWLPNWRGRNAYWEPVSWQRQADQETAIALYRYKRENGVDFENRWFMLFRRLGEDQIYYFPVLSQTIITSTPGSNQTITSDATWNNSNNTVEVIGAGGVGHTGNTSTRSAGGGGAYTKIVNFSFAVPGTTQATLQIGNGSSTSATAGGDTWFNNTVFPTSGTGAGAKGGSGGGSGTGGNGGASASAYANPSTGAVKNSGGNGSAGASQGAGGAAGPNGIGGNGSSTQGGNADGNTVSGPTTTNNGNSGTEFDATHGCGTGAFTTSGAKNGGLYGGGSVAGSSTAGTSAQGIAVLTWTPGVAAIANQILAIYQAINRSRYW